MILRGATVITSLDPVRVAIGDVRVIDGRIESIGGLAIGGASRDCSGCLVIPGNVCAHTHLYSALARGMPYALQPPRNFLQILQRVWWRLDRALDIDEIRASALVGGMEALLSGTTTLIDHHASPNAIDGSLDVIADALGSLGARSVLCYETTDRDGQERAQAGLDENHRFLERIREGELPLVRGLVGAHASFTLSDDTLAALAGLVSEFDAGLHIHVAEDRVDTEAPIERLAEGGVLDEQSLLAHCVHLDDGEIELVREAGATVAHNTRSNMNNSIGRAHVGRFGSRLVLGTDGIGEDLFEESHTAYFRLREDDDTAGVDWPLARLAEGARLAGRLFDEPLLGTLEPGAPADLVVLDYAAPAPVNESSFAGHWVYGLAARAVRDVMVGGEWVVQDRRLTRVDQEQLAREARVDAGRLWRRLEQIPASRFDGVRSLKLSTSEPFVAMQDLTP